MNKIILRFFILILLILLVFIVYLSTVGIKTKRFNDQISSQIKNINENLDIKLKDIFIVLDPLKFKLKVKTLGVDLDYKNKTIELESINSEISIKSYFNNRFSLDELNISTKSIEIKDLISFIGIFNNDPKIFIAGKFIKKGYLIANVDLKFDESGKIKDNFKINGLLKNGKIDFFEKNNLSKIDFNFNVEKKKFQIDNAKLLIDGQKIYIPNLKIEKKDNGFKFLGKLDTDEIRLNEKQIDNLIGTNFLEKTIDKIEFQSENFFSFDIDKKFKLKNTQVKSNIKLNNLVFFNKLGLKKAFSETDKEIILKNHKINLNYNDKELILEGAGNILIEKDDKIKYKITKNKKNIEFNTSLEILNNKFKLDFINYEKKDKDNLKIDIKGKKDLKGDIYFKEISLIENENKVLIQDLNLTTKYALKEFKSIKFDYTDRENLKNDLSIIKKKNKYYLSGNSYNANKLIEDLLKSDNKKKKILDNDFILDVKIKKTFLDKKNIIRNINGYLNFKNGEVFDANLKSNFDNQKKIFFTIQSLQNEKITTLFAGDAKPLVDRYAFVKGFDEGSLDFYSNQKGQITNSTLKIYDFKLKELPALTKLLTLASLQGVADLLSGEGIRFNEFEMNYKNKDNLMTIDEIYAIGPAISILMSGYIEKDKLVSLRGTLVPATTLNKTIGSIPILGDILVGDKTGEGIFGVSFKIKGPPKKLETSVNPIKTLTPRFITRTLEKIKKN